MNDVISKIKDVIRFVAPTIATALGGPLTGSAVAAISNALFGDTNHTIEEIEGQVNILSPDKLVELKKVENDFKLKLEQIGLDQKKLEQLDRDSARKREIEMAKAGTRDYILPILAIIITIGVFCLVGSLYFFPIEEKTRSIFELIIGNILGYFGVVISYYFGSSISSDHQLKKRGLKND